jgi:hypothetical protein
MPTVWRQFANRRYAVVQKNFAKTDIIPKNMCNFVA